MMPHEKGKSRTGPREGSISALLIAFASSPGSAMALSIGAGERESLGLGSVYT